MGRRSGTRLLLAALVAGALAVAAGTGAPARAQQDSQPSPRIYRWIDANGIAHYTTDPKRVPKALRADIPESAPEAPPQEAPAAKSPESSAAPPAGTSAAGPAGAHKGPDTWATMNRGEAPPPARSLSSKPFSEGGAEGVASGSPAGAGASTAPPPSPPGVQAAPPPSSNETSSSTAPPDAQTKLDDLDYRIAELEAGIKADEKQIAAHLANPKAGGPLASGDDPKFRELAARLPERLKELRKLQDERAKLVQK